MKKYTLSVIAIVVVMFLASANYSIDSKALAEVEKIDNVYVFVNSKPTTPYDTVFQFYFAAVTYQQTRPLANFYKNVVKSGYKKDEGKPFDGILFSSSDGYHYAIKFK